MILQLDQEGPDWSVTCLMLTLQDLDSPEMIIKFQLNLPAFSFLKEYSILVSLAARSKVKSDAIDYECPLYIL